MIYPLIHPEDEPIANTYVITLTVSDISKTAALDLANEAVRHALLSPAKNYQGLRSESDVKVTVAHVKALSASG